MKTHHFIISVVSFLIGLVAMYAAIHRGSDNPMPTGDAGVPRHDVKMDAPVKALDKKVLKAKGAISGNTEQAKDKEVLATGNVETSDGSKTVAAVLDVKTGNAVLIEHQPFMEWISRQEIGVGYGLVDGDLARAVQYRFTFGRVWSLYGTVQAEAFQVDRPQDRNPWNVMAFMNYRW